LLPSQPRQTLEQKTNLLPFSLVNYNPRRIPVHPEGATFRWGAPERLFDFGYVGIQHSPGNYHEYAVSPNGHDFCFRPDVPLADAASLPIHVILTWTSMLK